MADDFGFFSSSEGAGAEEDPAAAFLAQQESEIAGIENDEGFGPTDGESASAPAGQAAPPESGEPPGGPKGTSKVTEQEWREKAKKDLEEWNLRQNEQVEKNRANNRIADKAFYQQPDADVIGYVDNPQYLGRASEEAFLKESKEETPGSEWEKVAQLCDFNPKSSKQSKDVSRMRSVLISLKQMPLSR
ncbi:clathrin light chain B isoform X3 [Indicator indicator]|uniref:clathrin light chain B isoform X3 n=1 Tax=Indicator indicator TaxID=1002788 RepID=UPI0023DF1779|nr:clathrin light chain B isoform X3 [Indicator indicator]